MRNLLVFFCVLLSACASQSTSERLAAQAPESANAGRTAAVPGNQKDAGKDLETSNQRVGKMIESLIGQSFFFKYDDFALDPKYDALVTRFADVAKALPRGRLVLEGHADERGSKEFNLALGQKRAEAVGNALQRLGAPPARVEAISLGEEKPRAACHDERCWKENRRVDVGFELK